MPPSTLRNGMASRADEVIGAFCQAVGVWLLPAAKQRPIAVAAMAVTTSIGRTMLPMSSFILFMFLSSAEEGGPSTLCWVRMWHRSDTALAILGQSAAS